MKVMKKRNVKLEYDPDVDAAYLTLRSGRIVESEEVQPGLIVDFDANEQIVGVEILRCAQGLKSKGAKYKPLVTSR
jgi:uncharacterized protein YuzE